MMIRRRTIAREGALLLAGASVEGCGDSTRTAALAKDAAGMNDAAEKFRRLTATYVAAHPG